MKIETNTTETFILITQEDMVIAAQIINKTVAQTLHQIQRIKMEQHKRHQLPQLLQQLLKLLLKNKRLSLINRKGLHLRPLNNLAHS